MLTNSA